MKYKLNFRLMMKICCVLCLICLLSFPVSAGGFTVTSISQDGDYFLINLVVDGSGEAIEGYVYPDFNIPGIKVQEKIKITISKATEKLNYAVSNHGTLWKYSEPIYYDAINFWTGVQCPVKPAYCFIINKKDNFGFNKRRIVVFSKNPIGSYGKLENPDISILQTLSIKINNSEYKESIGTGETTRSSIQFKNAPINVRIVGQLLTGRGYPNQNLYVATHRIDTSRWNIAFGTNYERYIKSLTETDTLLNSWDEQQQKYNPYREASQKWLVCSDDLCSNVINQITEHNSNVDKLLSQSIMIDYGAATSVQSFNGYDGNIYDTLNRPITNTEMIIRIKGSILRTVILSGEPKIIKIESPSFASGDNNAYVKIYFENVGTDQGTFAARTNGSFESEKVTVLPGDTSMLTLFLRSGLNASEIKNGQIEVYDVASGSNDTSEYQLNITVPKLFIPDETRVYNEVVTKSEPDGMSEYKILDFSGDTNNDGIKDDPQILQWDGTEYSTKSVKTAASELEARETPKPTPVALYIPPVKPPEPTFDYMWLIIIVLIFILGMLAMNFFSNRRPQRKNGYAPVIIIFVLGLLVCVILFVLYWGNVQDFGNKIIEDMIKRRIGI